MAKAIKSTEKRVVEEESFRTIPFTGVARTVEAYDNQGFRNFKILTLHILKGMVVKIDYSDPYANFETIARMELANEQSILHLNNNWKSGRTLEK